MAPTINPNFDEGIQPGTYMARIKTCQQKTSKAGNPYLNWKLEIVGGPSHGTWIYHSTPFSGRGASLFKQLIQAAYDPTYESGAIDTDVLIGCALNVEIEKGLNQDGSESAYMKVVGVSPAAADPSGPNFGEEDIPF